MMFETWTLAVFGLMNSSAAIWGLERPAATSSRTAAFTAVSPKASIVGPGARSAEKVRSRGTARRARRASAEPRRAGARLPSRAGAGTTRPTSRRRPRGRRRSRPARRAQERIGEEVGLVRVRAASIAGDRRARCRRAARVRRRQGLVRACEGPDRGEGVGGSRRAGKRSGRRCGGTSAPIRRPNQTKGQRYRSVNESSALEFRPSWTCPRARRMSPRPNAAIVTARARAA